MRGLLLVLPLALGRECGKKEIFKQDITGCTSLRHVDNIHGSAKWLGRALHKNADLETIDLHHTFLDDDDATELAFGLRGNTKLHRLAMHNNKITDAGARAIGEALAENTALTTLRLSSNAVSDDGAAGLALGLKANTALRRLDLYFNLVGDQGAKELAMALHENHALRTLNLDSNRVGDDGAMALAAALPVNHGLAQLTLAYNKVKNDGALALEKAARADAPLQKLSLGQNKGVYGDAVETISALTRDLAERQKLADWLAETELADGVATPALLSPFAAPVQKLGAYRKAGLVALKGMGKSALEAHAALAALSVEQKARLVPLLLRRADEAAAPDEL